MMMEHKEIKMVVGALILGGLLYFGMQHYKNNSNDNVKIQSESEFASREEKMKQALVDLEEKIKEAPADRQEKLKQIEEKIKARLERMEQRSALEGQQGEEQ